jgi:hypothetical protein
VTFTDPKLFNLSWDTDSSVAVRRRPEHREDSSRTAGEKVGLPAYSVTNLTIADHQPSG